MFVSVIDADGGNITYTYDNAGRLIKADYGGGKSITYEYDNAGNMTKKRYLRVHLSLQMLTPQIIITTISRRFMTIR
ncbi:MAG TPA: RHS repeat protein [Nitrospirae bacterium]|nr:RHS repeat protein [Nitrospirota bacterium]